MRMKRFAVMALTAALSVGSVMTASAAWLQDGGNWRYQNDNGTFQTGTWFQDVDGKWYHFDNNGNMQKGWFLDADGKWYFMAYHGAMQTGLIRVDNAVYFMNPSGDLFIGEKAINGVTYNFGLYGTTNGTPSVGQSATFGGNGNQTTGGNGGGGGGVTPTPTPEEKVEEAVNKVEDAIKNMDDVVVKKEILEDGSAEVEVKVATVITPDTEKKVQAEVKSVVKSALDTVEETEEVTINIAGGITLDKSYTAKEWKGKLEDLVGKYLTTEMQEANEGATATVTTKVAGKDVTYTISIADLSE